jgi:tRNA 2-thiocytidine biosynthesis protein TtcA
MTHSIQSSYIPLELITPDQSKAKALEKVEKKLLNYLKKAIHDYGLIQKNDKIMVCLSGGKDSFTLLFLLNKLNNLTGNKFSVFSYTLDQSQPGWDDTKLKNFLEHHQIPYEIETRNTYAVVMDKIPEGKSYCSLCSRLRRGNIYRYARDNNFNKVALGHHRDDAIRTLFMSICYSGEIRSMPPKLLSDDKKNIVIRPLIYCQEKDIKHYAELMNFPLIPCNLCGSQTNLARVRMRKVIDELTAQNPKVPSNILHALQTVKKSQLLDKQLWDFTDLERERSEGEGNGSKSSELED